MARKQPFAFIGGSYADDTRPWSVQDTVNYLPTPAELSGTRSEMKLKSPPGFTVFSEIGASPIRGARNVEGRMYVVSGTNLVQINPGGSFTSLGSIPGVGPVSISHNQINGGNEVTFVNGNAGYVLNTITNVLTQITDDAYPGSFVVDYIDQYMVHVEPGRRYWFHSELASATSFNALDRYEAESSPDLITTLIVANSQVIVFGERTIQFFQNVGAATNTFVTSQNTVVELGCDAPYSVARIVNTVIFKSTDGSVYALNGNTPQRISTRPIEQALAQCDPRNMRAYTWEDRGHKVYYLTCPDGRTWGYDLTTGLWHRRQSYTYDRWRLNTLTFWNRAWYGGDSFTGLFYQLDWNIMHEAGSPLVSERIGPVIASSQNRVTIHEVEFVMDTAGADPDELMISGDLPDGTVGAAGVMSYLAFGGVPPYTFSIVAGSLPPGAAMNAAGLVTYAYTTAGSYSWSVQVEDAFGDTAVLDDSARVIDVLWGVTYDLNYALTTNENWLVPTAITSTSPFAEDRLFSTGGFVVMGQNGVSGSVRRSDDNGVTLTIPVGPTADGVRDITSAEGRWYVGGRDGGSSYTYSDDGMANVTFKVTRTNQMASMVGRVYTYHSPGDKFSSADRGDNWVAASEPFGTVTPKLVCGNGLIAFADVSAGTPRIAFSVTGIGATWTVDTVPAVPGSTIVTGVARTNASWVMTTDNGRVLYKLDSGGGWVLHPTNFVSLKDVRSNGSTTYAVGASGRLIRSLDFGVTWTNIPHSFGAGADIKQISPIT